MFEPHPNHWQGVKNLCCSMKLLIFPQHCVNHLYFREGCCCTTLFRKSSSRSSLSLFRSARQTATPLELFGCLAIWKETAFYIPPEINFCWGKHTSVVKESILFPPASHLCSMFWCCLIFAWHFQQSRILTPLNHQNRCQFLLPKCEVEAESMARAVFFGEH